MFVCYDFCLQYKQVAFVCKFYECNLLGTTDTSGVRQVPRSYCRFRVLSTVSVPTYIHVFFKYNIK